MIIYKIGLRYFCSLQHFASLHIHTTKANRNRLPFTIQRNWMPQRDYTLFRCARTCVRYTRERHSWTYKSGLPTSLGRNCWFDLRLSPRSSCYEHLRQLFLLCLDFIKTFRRWNHKISQNHNFWVLICYQGNNTSSEKLVSSESACRMTQEVFMWQSISLWIFPICLIIVWQKWFSQFYSNTE